MSSWLEEILDSTKESEAPERYYWWSALAAISATSRRKVYLNRFQYKLYPNIYVILVGPSGLRKTTAISLVSRLVHKVDCTRILNGRASIQAVIKELGRAYTCRDKSIITDGVAFLLAPELDTMLVKDEQTNSILMDLYDTHTKDNWKNILVGKDNKGDTLKNIYLTLLGGSNETNLSSALPRSAVEGGLIARSHIILEEKKKRINSLVYKPKIVPDIDNLSKRLYEISNLDGEFQFDNISAQKFDKWYNSFMTLESMDKTGTLDRIGDTILKVAMNISLSNKNDLVLLSDEIEEAIVRCQETIVGMRKVFLGSGEHSLAKPTAHVLRILVSRKDHKIRRATLLSSLSGEADAIDLDRIITTLDQANAINVISDNGEVYYELRESVLEKFNSIVREQEND